MVVNADFSTKNSQSSQTKSLTTNSTNIFGDRQQTEKLEKYVLAGTTIGTGAAMFYQQILLAVFPLTLSLYLSQFNNRRRWAELEQQNQTTVAKIHEVKQSHQTISQLKKDLLPRQALAPIKFQLRKAENQRILIEKRFLPQLAEVQQSVVGLEHQISALQEQLTARKVATTSQPLAKGERGRVMIFIDAANLYHALLEKDWEIDYGKLLDFLSANGSLVAAYFYTGRAKNQPSQERFLSYLRRVGYQIIDKQVTQFSDGSKKANLDVELALDMVRLADSYDTAILVSGDGDFSYAVKLVKEKQVRVEVVSFPSVTSKALINVSDRYFDLDTLKNQISKSDS
jgi:uncharacterized LabA/DUF88 family protein